MDVIYNKDKRFNTDTPADHARDFEAAERLAEVLKYARQGLNIFPAKVAADPKTGKLSKTSFIKGWPQRATTDEKLSRTGGVSFRMPNPAGLSLKTPSSSISTKKTWMVSPNSRGSTALALMVSGRRKPRRRPAAGT